MENREKRARENFPDGEIFLCEESYGKNLKEIKMFENIKSDMSLIISEQLRKRSRTTFKLKNIEKKYIYLKDICDLLNKSLLEGENILKKDKELINAYFEYTTSNLYYIFIKYENIICDMSEMNVHMKLKLKKIKEEELMHFKVCYEKLKNSMNILKEKKSHIILLKEDLHFLNDEYDNIQKIMEDKKSKDLNLTLEKSYNELLIQLEKYKKELEEIKEKCNNQMKEKKKTCINLNMIQENILDINEIIKKLNEENDLMNEDLEKLENENNEIIKKIMEDNNKIEENCHILNNKLESIENEISDYNIKKKDLLYEYENLKNRLKNITLVCNEKKKKDENYSNIIKNKSEMLISNKKILKETDKEYQLLNDDFLTCKENYIKLEKVYENNQNKLEDTKKIINDYICMCEEKKVCLLNIEKSKENNEIEKIQILDLIENYEKELIDQKNIFLKLSKILNLIHLSYEQYDEIQNEKCTMTKKEDDYTKKYEELLIKYENVKNQVKDKKEILDNKKQEIKKVEDMLNTYNIEMISYNDKKEVMNKNEKELNEKKNKCIKKLKDEETNHNEDIIIKKTKNQLELKYEELKNNMHTQKIEKQQQHNNFLKQGEKEKLECDLQLFISEIKNQIEKDKEEKKNIIIQKERELQIYQKRYSSLKVV
ncbi:hypothetical protein PFMG_03071 [Plasmodium falciparum IGH-CR14]|uniref:Uncharacterized protein n=1 Tax=Plasmodium falciparum IGH-CR14 TaxID=580059 RepID=A0A0L1IB25_PLAFA|nr:hypothetical protein PFMG_03071 [Plasmodium falciparum IGH-CR14]